MNNINRIISSADNIDLTGHGIIEAHAGTGKTYTIVKLVLRILEQPADVDGKFIHLRDMLLVTYTEKAAGELKTRIQKNIAPRIKELRGGGSDRLATHLENCLNNMHEALIGTVHSVCLRLLQTWPFETGVNFNTRITNDVEGTEPVLRDSMRTDWQDETSGLPQALRALERQNIKLEKKHLSLVRKIALEFLGGSGAEIDTSVYGGISIEELVARVENADISNLSELKQQLLFAFLCRAAEMLAVRYSAHKRQNGLISYNDMLRLMYEAIHGDKSVMLETLRRRLRYGIIDEFQDTSVIQWNIFKKIFLDDNMSAPHKTAKMYIVGDPKQSIYSFQNADIQSYIAAKNTILELGGNVYGLVDNYRSLPEMIGGYNAILSRKNCNNDTNWFLFEDAAGNADISYPSAGEGGQCARPPKRDGSPQYTLPYRAVQVVPVRGNAGECRQIMAIAARKAIQKLKGMTVSIPKGLEWEDVTLDYSDFAVIVETHDFAAPFIDEFREHRIPCVKYKLRGVFKSALARDLLAILTAIRERNRQAPRIAALFTHFFNKMPEAILPEEDLQPCLNHNCSGDKLCIAHALDSWGKLADRQFWAQLFRDILDRTEIRQKLIRLIDGERKLADLQQVVDYCMEYLYQHNSSLKLLIDHLERLYNDDEQAEQDKNIHTLSTEKTSVKILTMHASKGLEFPVVFIMNRASVTTPHGPNILQWTDGNRKRRFSPYISISQKSEERKRLEEQIAIYEQDRKRERRRFLYVAMTRPQIMLFVPMFEKEDSLSPRLGELVKAENEYVGLFNENVFCGDDNHHRIKSKLNDTHSVSLDDIPKLSLHELINRETSYTQLNRRLMGMPANDVYDDILSSDEYHTENIDTDTDGSPTSALPGGKLTGDALHRTIEEVLRADDIRTTINTELDNIVTGYLRYNGILGHPLLENPDAAIGLASSYVKAALTVPYLLADGGEAIITNLPKSDRIPELEFLQSCKPHRIRGFMDLVFRVRNDSHPAHPYRYYIIDWKSDILQNYDRENMAAHCRRKNYTLQSQIYAHALDKYLQGILGARYSRRENLGEAFYVFLRGAGAHISENIKSFTFNDADIYILYDRCFRIVK